MDFPDDHQMHAHPTTDRPTGAASRLNALLTPGMLVRHIHKPEWGIGQVQSNIGGKITANFEHRGKVVFASTLLVLQPVNRL